MLEGTKISNMVARKQDRLKALYQIWMEDKEKQFAELHAEAAARIAEKDERDYLLDKLKIQVCEWKHKCGYWQDKYNNIRQQKKQVDRIANDQVRELEFARSQANRDKRQARRAIEETKHLRQ